MGRRLKKNKLTTKGKKRTETGGKQEVGMVTTQGVCKRDWWAKWRKWVYGWGPERSRGNYN